MSRITSVAVLLGSLATAVLRLAGGDTRWADRPAWLVALCATLLALTARLAVMATDARRGHLPWSRLLLPAVVLVEGAGLWWGDGAPAWQLARLATAIALELAVVAVAVHQLRRASVGPELPEDRLARPLARLVPPRAARLIAFELVIVGSALRFLAGGWRRPAPPGFTYHRESSLRLLLQMLPLLAIGDVALLELVILPHAAPWLRIAAHALALYGLLWLVGLYASLRARPHRIHAGRATLHRGLLGHVDLSLDQVASIGELPPFTDDWQRRAYGKRAIRAGLPGPTMLDLRLRTPIRPLGLLGAGRASDRVLVAVDDPTAFIAALRASPS